VLPSSVVHQHLNAGQFLDGGYWANVALQAMINKSISTELWQKLDPVLIALALEREQRFDFEGAAFWLQHLPPAARDAAPSDLRRLPAIPFSQRRLFGGTSWKDLDFFVANACLGVFSVDRDGTAWTLVQSLSLSEFPVDVLSLV
jgi:hypothetical protein